MWINVAWRGYRNRAAHGKIIEHPHYLNIHRYDILSHTSKISCADEAFMSATFATERKVFMPKIYKYASESIYERDLCDSKYVILCECENTTIPIGLSE